MGDRPEWMPTISRVAVISTRCGWSTETTFRRTGLRAKLHELESLIDGQEGAHWVDRVKARIEEIRKELEG